ncbi:MAG TPA: PH domain-containing protein [Fimbriimonadaceae bacterium]|nr:PH domain-containing protein [Fimbriimonadaceae bacterium]
MSEPVFRRLNPLTIAVEFVRVIQRLIFPLLLFLFSTHDGTELIVQIFGGLVVVSAIARYLSFQFAVHDGHLIIRSGIIVRNNRTIPLSKIQNINIEKNIIHRLLGLVDIKIETAAGRHAEASISALSEAEAAALKVELTQGVQHEVESTEPKAARGRIVYKITPMELILAGATENRIFAIVGAVMGGSYLFQDRLTEVMKNVLPSEGGSWTNALIAGFLLLLVGWLFSIVHAVVTYANFELSLENGRLRRHYGLLNQIESVVPLPRVQLARTTETVFQRMLSLCKLYVETAGSYEKKDMGGSSLVSPLLENDRLKEIGQTIMPDRGIGYDKWTRVSAQAIRINFQKTLIAYAVIVALSSLYFGTRAFWALIPLAVYALLVAWIHYRTTGYEDRRTLLATRHGVFSRQTYYVPTERIQSVKWKQSPLQRHLKVASVTINTAAVGAGSFAPVDNIETERAESLALSLHKRSCETASISGEVL